VPIWTWELSSIHCESLKNQRRQCMLHVQLYSHHKSWIVFETARVRVPATDRRSEDFQLSKCSDRHIKQTRAASCQTPTTFDSTQPICFMTSLHEQAQNQPLVLRLAFFNLIPINRQALRVINPLTAYLSPNLCSSIKSITSATKVTRRGIYNRTPSFRIPTGTNMSIFTVGRLSVSPSLLHNG
jgi:hypothetical protein